MLLAVVVILVAGAEQAPPVANGATTPTVEQQPTPATRVFDEAVIKALVGRIVEISHTSGLMTHGKLLSGSATTIVLEFDTGDVRSFSAPEIDQIRVYKVPTAAPTVDSAKKGDAKSTGKSAEDREKAIRRARLYSNKADAARELAASDNSTATFMLIGGVTCCAGAAGMGVGALFICGIPLLIGAAVASAGGLGLVIGSIVVSGYATENEKVARRYMYKAEDEMVY